jgi:porphobilinogen synthase
MRRLRGKLIQPFLREQALRKTDLVAPLFVDETTQARRPITSMPGQFRYPPKEIGDTCQRLWDKGIRAVLLFGIPGEKDGDASAAYDPGGVVQRAIGTIKKQVPGMLVITDVCACE